MIGLRSFTKYVWILGFQTCVLLETLSRKVFRLHFKVYEM